MHNTMYENVAICKTIILLTEARELMLNNLAPKDDIYTTEHDPCVAIDLAIRKQIALLAYENGLILEEL